MAGIKNAVLQMKSPSSGDCPTFRFAPRLLTAWQSFLRNLFPSYHPERHYMRGPGPKWREKHPA